jgi:hypothetical protein
LILVCLRGVRFSSSMHSNSLLRRAHEYGASKEAYEKATQMMCTQVSIPVSERYNALYGERDLHRALMALSISNGYAESGMKALEMEAGVRVPSGSWVRDRVVEGVESEEKMRAMLDGALDATLQQLRSFRVFTGPVTAAIDTHDLPRYDKDLDGGFLRRGKPDRGTTKHEVYATLHCVEEGRRAQIACEPFSFFDEKKEVVQELLTKARLEEVELSLLLLDRGFFSCSVIDVLKKNGQTFLMPCIVNKGVKKAIIEYAEGKRGRISRYEMGPKEDRVSFTLVILPKAGAQDETDPSKRYIPFATSMRWKRIVWNVKRLPKDYRSRWGIETGYVGVERLRARTTSRNHSLRLLYFYYSLMLYNVWLLANLILAKRFSKILEGPSITIPTIKSVMTRMTIESLRRG